MGKYNFGIKTLRILEVKNFLKMTHENFNYFNSIILL